MENVTAIARAERTPSPVAKALHERLQEFGMLHQGLKS